MSTPPLRIEPLSPRPFLYLLLILNVLLGAFAIEPPSPPAYGVRLENIFIPMSDGVRIAATLYLPDGAKATEKFPAILEYHPYRKDDAMAARDYPIYTYFARRGYVCARVDIRGFGSSEGIPTDREYSQQEQKDGAEIIHWLATQSWSNGNVGMMGISWSGFNSLQMAMRHTPGLKAIIAIAATAELFHDDVHFWDGIAHVDEFELDMDLSPGITPSPDYSLDEKILGPRFDTPPWSLLYFKHQRDGAFWRSPVRPYGDINIPSFLIGGMLDGYRDSVVDMLQQTHAPIKAIVGPWNHAFPNDAVPGPEIEWRREAVRWWDYWLKGRDTGILNDPKLVVYMQHYHPPDTTLQNVPGEWRREDSWPPPEAQNSVFFLQPDHSLNSKFPDAAVHQLKYVPTIGVEAGFWWGELLTDVRPVDAFSLVYDSAPLQDELAILGRPQALLKASANAPLADWIVRLSDVAPDGSVTQITGAGINGAERDSMTDPQDLEPGKTYTLKIPLHLTSWVFPKGHRIRVAVSNALWPMMIPTPYNMTTSLELGGPDGSSVTLPVVPVHGNPAPAFAPPEPNEERRDVEDIGDLWPGEWITTRDEIHQKTTATWRGQAEEDYPWGKEFDTEKLTYDASDAHPDITSTVGEASSKFELSGRTLVWSGRLILTSDQKNFYYKYTRELRKNGQLIKTKTWEETIPRDHQ